MVDQWCSRGTIGAALTVEGCWMGVVEGVWRIGTTGAIMCDGSWGVP
jgi:hypothetical protein